MQNPEHPTRLSKRLAASFVLLFLFVACALAAGMYYFIAQNPGQTPEEQMEHLQADVIAIRGLQPGGTFTQAVLSPSGLRERVINDFLEDYSAEEAEMDALVLSILGLLEPGYDLVALYTELYSEQIIGFYDNETREMVVVSQDVFRGPERLTYVHEYTHALQDQNFDVQNGLDYNQQSCEEDSERCAAVQALLEGDASFTEVQWYLEYSTRQDQQEIQEFYENLESPVFDQAPAFLRQDFTFPYNQGYDFVRYLFEQGGWDRVNTAYSNLPVSTEQILHPEKYPQEIPAPVHLPDLLPILGDGWEQYEAGVLGEWYTFLILAFGMDYESRLTEASAAAAAAGWGGDAYAVYYHAETQQTVMALVTVWDQPGDRAEFSNAFLRYAGRRFGAPANSGPENTWQDGPLTHIFRETQDATIWIAAPGQALAETILNTLD